MAPVVKISLPYPITASTNRDLVPMLVILIMSVPELISKGDKESISGRQKPLTDSPRAIQSNCCVPCVSCIGSQPSRLKSAPPLPTTEPLAAGAPPSPGQPGPGKE